MRCVGSDTKRGRWQVEQKKWKTYTLTRHAGEVTSVAFSPDGQYVVSGSRGGSVKIWHAKTGSLVRSTEKLMLDWYLGAHLDWHLPDVTGTNFNMSGF